MDCFVLLDDHGACPEAPRSRLYTELLQELCCDGAAQLESVWAQVLKAQAGGAHAVVLADYEWGAQLVGVPSPHGAGRLRVLLFAQLQCLSADQVEAWLAALEGAVEPAVAGVAGMCASVDDAAFESAIARIQRAIFDGETYQVNYSYRLDFQVAGEPLALYRRLRLRQRVAYGALIRMPAGDGPEYVLSFSPELFLRHQHGELTTCPMKGTAPRTGDGVADAQSIALLGAEKNRAENLMIVDLLRNDLGRVANTGSVHVPALFSVEAYATVFQMTSTVTASLPSGCDFPQLLRALFPCGSVTGAPKHHTMQLIGQLETTPRGLYCGAIGWVDAAPVGRACGDFCLSVAIRTLEIGAADQGLRQGRLGIGAGIVADSTATEEHAECELKARFLTGLDAGFSLIETMYATRSGGIRHGQRHLARISASARALGFRCSLPAVMAALDAAVSALAEHVPYRLRLLMHPDGRHNISSSALPYDAAEPVPLLLAEQALNPQLLLLGHKTTLRSHYDIALRLATEQGAFDALFFNTRGELTEGARSNVFLRIGGAWLTPALHCGVLPGVMRAVLLEDPDLNAKEAVLTQEHLLQAEEIIVCNALRGRLHGRLEEVGRVSRVNPEY